MKLESANRRTKSDCINYDIEKFDEIKSYKSERSLLVKLKLDSTEKKVEIVNTITNDRKSINPKDYQCGYGPIRPKWLQKFNNANVLLFLLSIVSLCHGMVMNGFTSTSVSTIQKFYSLSSVQIGLISAIYDSMIILVVIPMTYFATKTNKIRIVAISTIIFGFGSIIFAFPHLLRTKFENTVTSNDLSDYFCSNNTNVGNTNLNCVDVNPLKLNYSKSYFSYSMFLTGNALHGLASSTFYTLPIVIIDENVSSKLSPVYTAIYYSFAVGGAACGYLLGGIFLTIDEGWWIGFVLSFCICILVGFPLSAFGRYVPEHALIEKNRDRSYSYTSTPLEKFNRNTAKSTINKSFENDPEKTTLDNDEINVLQTLRYFNLQELIPAIKRILTNKVLMLIITANTIDSFLIIGLILFIPKYIETQFNTPASSSSIYAGIAAIPSGIIGTVIGGIIIRNMNVTKRLLFSVVCFGIAVPVMFAFYLKCDTIKITGLNEAYNDRTSIQLNDACNTQCNCTISNIRDLSKSMICAITPEDEKIYFISPCFAGCRGESDNKICNCFHSKWRYPANNDVCHNSMCTVMISVYIIMIGIGILLTFASASSTIQSILRVVKFKDRSLATGVGWMFGRVFGTLPGPILFGLIIDKSCSLWNNTGCKGNSDWICLQYESEKLVKYATILALSCKILSLIVMSLAAFLHHRHCQKRKKSKRNIKYKLDV